MARALIVGCGCRGRALGRRLFDEGWAVRGTTRDPGRVGEIEAAGIEAVVADPDRVSSILDAIEGVAVLCWLLGSATGEAEPIAALHGPRLERVLEEIVDTPVRGVVYEAEGAVSSEDLERGEATLRSAATLWRIPFELITARPNQHAEWASEAHGAVRRVLAGR